MCFIASRADVDVSYVLVKFEKYQQSATASIKIVNDDIVEEMETFIVKLTLPAEEVYRNRLKYGYHQYARVYIKDSE